MVYDYQKGAKTPLEAFMLGKFEQTWEAQEQARMHNGTSIRKLIEKVEKLEKESWDREGAVEDMGGGGG